MQLHHRVFNRELDMPLYNRLLRKRGYPEMDGTYLPPTGVIVFIEESPICAGFMIKCDNGMAINTDLVSDPTSPKEIRNTAVEYLREVLYELARKHGLTLTTIFTKHKRLQEKLKSKNYVEIDSNLTQMGRLL